MSVAAIVYKGQMEGAIVYNGEGKVSVRGCMIDRLECLNAESVDITQSKIKTVRVVGRVLVHASKVGIIDGGEVIIMDSRCGEVNARTITIYKKGEEITTTQLLQQSGGSVLIQSMTRRLSGEGAPPPLPDPQ